MAGDEDEMRQALKRVAATLKDAEIPFALSGGYAAWVHGGPEPDHDVDFMAPPESVPEAVEPLEKAGLRVEQPSEDWLVKVYDGQAMVDLVHRPQGRPVDADRLGRAAALAVLSLEMPVLDPTDIIVDKLIVLDEHDCDLGSVLPVLRSLREQVDWRRVRAETRGSPFAEAALLLAQCLGIAPAVGGPA
ncbi:MAG: hypothetical protein ABJA34_05915 [Pseudonocardiales bacterium]